MRLMSRLADLKAKLAAREGQHGFEENVAALKKEIERLENKLAD
jgi:hypothetical protein